MRKLSSLLLALSAVVLFGCPEKSEDPKPAADTREDMKVLNFQMRDAFTPWMPEKITDGLTWEKDKVKFTHRKATEQECPTARWIDYKGSDFGVWHGTTFIIDISRYKNIKKVSFYNYWTGCSSSGQIYLYNTDGKEVSHISPDGGTAQRTVTITDNLENLKEIKIVSVCEMTRFNGVMLSGM